MLDLFGYRIETLPYKDLVKVHDILYADGPLLVHYHGGQDVDLLFYWVDYNENYNRWLVFELSKEQLYKYLSGGKSLRSLIDENKSRFVFIVDESVDGEFGQVILCNAFAIPDDYLPSENSFYTIGLPTFYDAYLREFSYISKLRERSYIFKLEPTDHVHDKTVSTKEAGLFLTGITKSIDSYIDYTATNKLKNTIGDRSRLNRTVNQLKQKVSPRVADSCYGSFQVSVAIDTVILSAETKEIEEWRLGLIEGYKNDVLDVDYASEEDAKAIVERFPDIESRKKIFEPILKILENSSVSLKVSSYNDGFVRDFKKTRPRESFKVKVIPPPTMEEILDAQERKTKIVTAVFKLPEGGTISDFRKKELIENLLFTQEGSQPIIPIESPIDLEKVTITMSSPIECTLMIDPKSRIILSNSLLDLYAEGANVDEVLYSVKVQLLQLVEEYLSQPDYVDEKTSELKRLNIKLERKA